MVGFAPKKSATIVRNTLQFALHFEINPWINEDFPKQCSKHDDKFSYSSIIASHNFYGFKQSNSISYREGFVILLKYLIEDIIIITLPNNDD